MYVCTYVACMFSYIHMHIILYTLVIDQVTGVTLTCKPVGLANQCTVMWNVSLHNTYIHSIVCQYV